MSNSLKSFLEALRASEDGVVERMGLHGSMEAVLVKADGSVEVTRKDNLVVDAGFDFVCDAIGAATGRPTVMSHIAVGTGNAAAAAGQTTLGTEVTRKAATYTKVNAKQFTVQVTFNAGEGTGALTEAGIFNASSGGVMFDRVVFSVINKGASDSLTVTFTITLS